MAKNKKELRELVAIRGGEIFAFPTKSARAGFVRDIKKLDPSIEWATTTLSKKKTS